MTNEGPASRSIIAKYCIQDCNLVHYLFNKVDVITDLVEMAKLCSVPMSFLIFRGQGIKLTSYVAKKCREKGVLMPCINKGSKDDGYEGAIVLNPKYLFCDEPNSGLDPQTSLVIDKLIFDITKEFNMTTVINTHDMNSVMEIGENILYMYNGHKEWTGTNEEIIFSKNERLNEFIFASKFLQDAKDMRMLEAKGIISDDRNMEEILKNRDKLAN